MQSIMSNFGTIVLYVGAFDALTLLLMGLVTAFIVLIGYNAQAFYDRIWPAVGILIGTSVGAVVVMLVTRWLAVVLS